MNRHHAKRRSNRRANGRSHRREKNEGAAMLITMLVLLSTTALAVFAVHSTTFEIRASGHARQAMQSQYLGETGLSYAMSVVDNQSMGAIKDAMEAEGSLSGGGEDVLHPLEPNLADNKRNYRIFPGHLNEPIAAADAESMGAIGPSGDITSPRQPYEPFFYVDVNDTYESVRAIPGNRADGNSRVQYTHATYTSRGRMRLTVGSKPYEAASDGRAYALSGP